MRKRIVVPHILLYLIVATLTLNAQSNNASSAYLAHLQQLYFENSNQQFTPYLEQALRNFDLDFPHDKDQDQALWLLAKLAIDNQRPLRAFCYLSELLLRWPRTPLKEEALNQLTLLKPALLLFTTPDSVINALKMVPGGNNGLENYFSYLSFIYALDLDTLNSCLIEGIQHYRALYGPQAVYGDVLLLWFSQLEQKKGNPSLALAHLHEITVLFPASTILPRVYWLLAQINLQLKHYELVKEYLLTLSDNFPQAPENELAQRLLGELYDRFLHQPQIAIEQYRIFLDNFPNSPYQCAVTWRLAHLLKEQKDYPASVQMFMHFYELCADSARAKAALQEVAELSLNQLQQPLQYANTLLILAQKESNPQKAADYLYRSARFFSQDSAYRQKAKQIYQLIIKNYPRTPSATLAQKALNQLKKE